MADTWIVARRLIYAAGFAAAIAVVPVIAAPTVVAQPADCTATAPAGQQPTNCAPSGGSPPGAPNIESGGGQDQQQHSGHH